MCWISDDLDLGKFENKRTMEKTYVSDSLHFGKKHILENIFKMVMFWIMLMWLKWALIWQPLSYINWHTILRYIMAIINKKNQVLYHQNDIS